jgi:hypothetical protein
MYESGSRVRLGELDSGSRLGYISPHTREWILARDTPHTNEFDSLEPKPSQTRTCVGTFSLFCGMFLKIGGNE